MPGFGPSFGPAAMSRLWLFGPPPLGTYLTPSEEWTGAAGSGFSALPNDPVRSTAKPVLRLLVPPYQVYTKELLVGVVAAANDDGSLFNNLGLQKVVAHFEGNQVDIASPSYETFDDANGNPVTYLAWWIRLRNDGRLGEAQVYFEAVPNDSTMQNRVIGPYSFFPRDTLYDHHVDVAPSQSILAGSRYPSLGAAFNYLSSVGAQNPLITITESGEYDVNANSTPNSYQTNGWFNVEASVPIIITKPNKVNTAAGLLRPKVARIRWRGSSIAFDFAKTQQYYQENAADTPWFDGCRIFNSEGRYALWNKGARIHTTQLRFYGYYTECVLNHLPGILNNVWIARGNDISNGYGDVFTNALVVVGNRVTDWDSTVEYAKDYPALTALYTGSGATATLSLSGGNYATSRTLTAKVDGASVGSITINRSTGDYLDVSAVVAWLDSLSDWSASLLDDTRQASLLGVAGGTGFNFENVDAKSAPLTLMTAFDIHSDIYQISNGGPTNVYMADNLITGFVGQTFFFSGTVGTKDFVVFNNAASNKESSSQYLTLANIHSQLNYPTSQLVFVHNSLPSQQMLIRTDSAFNGDGYTILANNVLKNLTWVNGPVDADIRLANNHLWASAVPPEGSIGTTTGGDDTTLFLDAPGGDFTPAGALRETRRASLVRWDFNRAERGSMETVGALALTED